jgi:hypothetical protein
VIVLCSALAWGAAPEGLRPVVASADVGQRYVRWRALEGLPPERLVCEPFWPEAAALCFRVWEEGKRRWVVTADLFSWGVDAAGLRSAVVAQAEAKVRAAEQVPIGGMEGSYLRLVDPDGWAAAGILRPDVLAERLGGVPIRVAVPAESVLVAWKVQGEEVDKVMAVGVRELYEQTPGPVSPKIHTWENGRWTPYGEARPVEP